MDNTMSSFKIENLYKMYTIIYIYIYVKFIYLHIYLVVSFQGQSITYLMAYPIIYNGTSWPSISKNGKETLAIVLELTAINKVSSAIGMLWWSVTSPPNFTKVPNPQDFPPWVMKEMVSFVLYCKTYKDNQCVNGGKQVEQKI